MSEIKDASRELAAQLIAEGRFEYKQIAEKVGVDRVTLQRWRKEKRFAARVDELSKEFFEAAKKRAIRRKEYRVNVLANLQSRLMQVMEERALDLADVPGGSSGLLVRQYKVFGENIVPEYAVDTGLIREMRAVQEQVAKELGELVEKHEMKTLNLKDMTDEQLAAFIAQGNARAGSDSDGSEDSGREKQEA